MQGRNKKPSRHTTPFPVMLKQPYSTQFPVMLKQPYSAHFPVLLNQPYSTHFPVILKQPYSAHFSVILKLTYSTHFFVMLKQPYSTHFPVMLKVETALLHSFLCYVETALLHSFPCYVESWNSHTFAVSCFHGFFQYSWRSFYKDPFAKLRKIDQKTINNDKTKKCKMIAPIHKNTNVSLILVVCDVMFCILAKHIISNLSGFFEGAKIF